MLKPRYTIRLMTRQDLDLAIDWAAAEGWNPGLQDADCFYAADADGFLMGWLAGQPIAAISVVKYGDRFGFLGFYIVRPEFRGQGYGWQLWQAGLATLAGRNIGLDGVVAQQENYVRSGFTLAHRNIRYSGRRLDSLSLDLLSLGSDAATDHSVVSLASEPSSMPPSILIEQVIAYDQAFFPALRAAFMRCWLTRSQRYAVGILHDSQIAGYGVIRPCREGYKVGPLLADTPQFAAAIFRVLQAHLPIGSEFYLDVPAVNAEAIALAESYAMTPVFETARMYTQSAPKLPLERTFGITTFELG